MAVAVRPPTANFLRRFQEIAPVHVAVDVAIKQIQQLLRKIAGFLSFHTSIPLLAVVIRIPRATDGCRCPVYCDRAGLRMGAPSRISSVAHRKWQGPLLWCYVSAKLETKYVALFRNPIREPARGRADS